MSGELLLEILTEEIPAHMQRDGLNELTKRVKESLGDGYLEPDSISGDVTPRRLTIVATGITSKQPDFSDERRGPRTGAPEAARAGFARSAGVAMTALAERDGYFYAEIRRVGKPAVEVLPAPILAAIEKTAWPKSMRFPAASLRWVRPIDSVVCLFDGEVVPLALGAVPVGRTTRGHRFLAPGEIIVADAADYRSKLRAASVVLGWSERRGVIEAGLAEAAAAIGARVKPDPGLLGEVTGLAEYPVVLSGRIDPGFMDLPPEVLATAMRTHQKYFSCLEEDGGPAPHFLFVANNRTADGGAAIGAGNERVLRARLSDARFFWDQDRKLRLEDRVAALKDRVFHARLGSVYDKVERVEKLAEHLAAALAMDPRFRGNGELKGLAARAARLCKADLSTGMVGEFPELQGVIGRYYARNDGEDPQVAEAIADHYKPLGPNDTCPTAPVSVVVALADKIDTLAAFFAIGEPPTGSRDPFALRRAAQGIIRIILENNLRVRLWSAFEHAWQCLIPIDNIKDDSKIIRGIQDLLQFLVDRLTVHLREQHVRHDLINAVVEEIGVLSHSKIEDDLVRLLARVKALSNFLANEDGANLLTAYRRASNIVEIEQRRDNRVYDGEKLDLNRLVLAEETALAMALAQAGTLAEGRLTSEDFEGAMATLAQFRRPVDEFFEKVTVNSHDPELRTNRLRLLSRIRSVMNQVADFSRIEG